MRATLTPRIYCFERRLPDTGKPHFKLRLDGSIEILTTRRIWGVVEADQFIRKHYGSRAAFATCYSFDYGTVCQALSDDVIRATQAGGVELVRKFLGLKSAPTVASRRASLAYHRARGTQPQWRHARVFTVCMEQSQ